MQEVHNSKDPMAIGICSPEEISKMELSTFQTWLKGEVSQVLLKVSLMLLKILCILYTLYIYVLYSTFCSTIFNQKIKTNCLM